MSAPAVSVVIPAYNAAKFIGEALESVLAQTFSDFETIVVDDGSTDGTAAVTAKYGERVRCLRQANAGAAAARNTGIRAARGTWLAFLDSDDQWQRDHLERLLATATAHPDAHLVYGSKTWMDEAGKPLRQAASSRPLPSGWIFGDLFEACVVSTCSTVLVRTETVRALGGFTEGPRLRVGDDYDLYLRIAARYQLVAAPDVRVSYRRHQSNLTLETVSYATGIIAALRTGERLLSDGQVVAENHPERIDARERMRRAYAEAVTDLFNSGEYRAVRRVGGEAIRRGLWTGAVLARVVPSLLPAPVVDRLRRRGGDQGVRREA